MGGALAILRRTEAFVWALALSTLMLTAGCVRRHHQAQTQTQTDVTVLAADLPSAPDWAKPMIGQPLSTVAPAKAECQGYADRVATVYKGAHGGVSAIGWSWDPDSHKPLQRILMVDPTGAVVGAGQPGGEPRPDVVAARPGVVTTPNVGWVASTQVTSGQVKVYGLTNSGAACQIGVLSVRG
jgi:hypothetical protein